MWTRESAFQSQDPFSETETYVSSDGVRSDCGLSSGGSVSRDSVESMLDRGRSYLSQIWDREAFYFAEWWKDAHDDAQLQLEVTERYDEKQVLHCLVRRYAAKQAENILFLAMRSPFISRRVAKQEFVGLYIMARCGIRSRDGTGRYGLESQAAIRILSCLGHQLKMPELPPQRLLCMNYEGVCPLFRHRSDRLFNRLGMEPLPPAPVAVYDSDDDDDDDSSTSSTGSLSTARNELHMYLMKQGGIAPKAH
eukprot:TRINITY_DN34436_c0_g1_i1.p1 TRINITY_DN34436_c0_g1~~TRINITY_DN34436_c0_g1_i1.p1  ORF type:complete len:251 (-),score=28.69 TRINITY_DN34436_c0_g1_i1:337-1089(-)